MVGGCPECCRKLSSISHLMSEKCLDSKCLQMSPNDTREKLPQWRTPVHHIFPNLAFHSPLKIAWPSYATEWTAVPAMWVRPFGYGWLGKVWHVKPSWANDIPSSQKMYLWHSNWIKYILDLKLHYHAKWDESHVMEIKALYLSLTDKNKEKSVPWTEKMRWQLPKEI